MTNPSTITTSLSTARKLKEAGFPQETTFFYGLLTEELHLCERPERQYKNNWDKWHAAAPTAEEVLRELPEEITTHQNRNGKLNIFTEDGIWVIRYTEIDNDIVDVICYERGNTIVEAASHMWLYLKEHGLLSPTTHD